MMTLGRKIIVVGVGLLALTPVNHAFGQMSQPTKQQEDAIEKKCNGTFDCTVYERLMLAHCKHMNHDKKGQNDYYYCQRPDGNLNIYIHTDGPDAPGWSMMVSERSNICNKQEQQ